MRSLTGALLSGPRAASPWGTCRRNGRSRWRDSCPNKGVASGATEGETHMAGKNTAAFGLYSDRTQVEQGVAGLLASRFRSEDISVLFPDNVGTKDFAHEKSTKAPEG